ncbi:hypothetical protein [Candidatus Marimicrobium litorale]|nr:hypothetical protein [Candidatus Marimicrobium litorale]
MRVSSGRYPGAMVCVIGNAGPLVQAKESVSEVSLAGDPVRGFPHHF